MRRVLRTGGLVSNASGTSPPPTPLLPSSITGCLIFHHRMSTVLSLCSFYFPVFLPPDSFFLSHLHPSFLFALFSGKTFIFKGKNHHITTKNTEIGSWKVGKSPLGIDNVLWPSNPQSYLTDFTASFFEDNLHFGLFFLCVCVWRDSNNLKKI